MRFALAALLFCFACHDHDHDGYSTYQACFDEHVGAEALPFKEAVVVCCADHPIDGHTEACGQTAAECVTYLAANLTSTATQVEIQAACDEYILQKGM
jgi:hypothetical protein